MKEFEILKQRFNEMPFWQDTRYEFCPYALMSLLDQIDCSHGAGLSRGTATKQKG
jgi:hypothetical protein